MKTRRRLRDMALRWLLKCVGYLALFCFMVLVLYILVRGLRNLTPEFFVEQPSALFQRPGMLPYLTNTLYVVVVTLLLSVPLGIGASLYLNIYVRVKWIKSLVQFLLDGLLGIPSVVAGFLGLVFFSRLLGLRTSLLAGALGMSITMIPLMMYLTRQALNSVPEERVRQAIAMGASRHQLVARIYLPECFGDILHGIFLCASRITAESAVFLLAAGAGAVAAGGAGSGGTLAVMVYVYVQQYGDIEMAFHLAAVLLLLTLLLAVSGSFVRRRWRPHNR